MKRSISVLLWILVGALASGVGIGYFLHAANADRRELVTEAEQAKQEAAATKAANDQLADEANKKLADASEEVANAQKLLKEYQDERLLMTQAVPLTQPTARQLKLWSEQVSVGLGVSVHLPPGNQALATDSSLVALRSGDPAGQWLSIAAYDDQQDRTLSQSLQNAEPVKYLVGTHLLLGVRGKLSDLPGNVYVLHAQSAASSTHLFWARSSTSIPDETILQTLATLNFRS